MRRLTAADRRVEASSFARVHSPRYIALNQSDRYAEELP
jgi:hypothetical protein